jgi:hypothetical protein
MVTTRLHLAPRLRKITVISLFLRRAIIARTRTNTYLPNIITIILSRKDRQVGQTAGMGKNEKCKLNSGGETPKVILTRDTVPYTGGSSELITRSLPMHEASMQTSSMLMHLA